MNHFVILHTHNVGHMQNGGSIKTTLTGPILMNISMFLNMQITFQCVSHNVYSENIK